MVAAELRSGLRSQGRSSEPTHPTHMHAPTPRSQRLGDLTLFLFFAAFFAVVVSHG